MRKYKNKVLKGLFKASVITALISGCALDSISIVPMLVLAVSMAYILIFILANTRG